MADSIDLDRVLADVKRDREFVATPLSRQPLSDFEKRMELGSRLIEACATIESLAAELRAARQRIEELEAALARRKSTGELLAYHAVLLNRYGPNSEEELAFVAEHGDNTDFCELAETARMLKAALAAKEEK